MHWLADFNGGESGFAWLCSSSVAVDVLVPSFQVQGEQQVCKKHRENCAAMATSSSQAVGPDTEVILRSAEELSCQSRHQFNATWAKLNVSPDGCCVKAGMLASQNSCEFRIQALRTATGSEVLRLETLSHRLSHFKSSARSLYCQFLRMWRHNITWKHG